MLVLAWLTAGIAAGIVGMACAIVLHTVQAAAFGYQHDSFIYGVQNAPPWRRVLALTIAGAVAGTAWWRLRAAGPLESVSMAMHPRSPDEPPQLPFWRTTADGVIQLFAVGCGASIGREGAPRQIAAAASVQISTRIGITPEQARTLMAAAAGAGLAAVYNVPLAGTLFVVEVMRQARRPLEALGTAVICTVAAVSAWPVVGSGPLLKMPDSGLEVHWTQMLPVLIAIVVGGLFLGALLTQAVVWARLNAPQPTWRLPVIMAGGFGVVGLVSIARPEVPGNGKGILELLLVEQPAWSLLFSLLLLKFALTVLTLRVGAVGGLLMPSLAMGAMLGASVASLAGLGGADIGACMLSGSIAVLAVTQRAPFFALALALELTWPGLPLVLCAIGAAIAATIGGRVAQRIGLD